MKIFNAKADISDADKFHNSKARQITSETNFMERAAINKIFNGYI